MLPLTPNAHLASRHSEFQQHPMSNTLQARFVERCLRRPTKGATQRKGPREGGPNDCRGERVEMDGDRLAQ